jgi:probable phosphoglycerate mutase
VLRAWLVRHGESESNAGAPTADPGAAPLTARGHDQAAGVAAAMPDPPALIVTSPYLRAAQTAEPTIARFPDARREEWPVEEFTFLGHLHATPTTGDERRPHVEAYWRRADPDLSISGAESFADLLGRAGACLDRLSRQPDGPVVVFTHGIFIRAVLWAVLTGATTADQTAMRAFHSFGENIAVPNCAVVHLRVGDGIAPRLVAGRTW